MTEKRKKISLLNNLDDILNNNFVNNQVFTYVFYTMKLLVINNITYDVSDKIVTIILYLDEIIIKIDDNDKPFSFTFPYIFIADIHIFLGDNND